MNSNRGVLIGTRKTDWVMGAETGIQGMKINLTGDWTKYLPTKEGQAIMGYETFACVTFSALHIVGTIINFMIANNLISVDKIQLLKQYGYVDENNSFNASDRFTAKMSGTGYRGNFLGNYMYSVWDSIRKDGLVPEAMWSMKGCKTVDEYYAEIPQEVKDFGKHFLEIFTTNYEWVINSGNCGNPELEKISLALLESPIQIAAPYCGKDANGITQPCGSCTPQHATEIYAIDDYVKQFDHYPPYLNRLSKTYKIPYAIKGVVTLTKEQVTQPEEVINHAFYTDIKFGQTSEEVVYLQKVLKKLGYFPANVLCTGYYGEITRQAVSKFQWDKKVANPAILLWNNGKLVGQSTRTSLNK